MLAAFAVVRTTNQSHIHNFARQRDRFKSFLPQVEHVGTSSVLVVLVLLQGPKEHPCQIILDNCSKYLREVEKMRQEHKPQP